MGETFNPLESELLLTRPERLRIESAWNEHVPFAMLLVELQRPGVIVELGTQWGISYCAFCQAVKTIRLETRCYAVDTWSGDIHAGQYGDEVYESLNAYHRQYETFSKLLRMTFDDALQQVRDGSVDLLHIDGLHTYEAVRHDYETWLPKMSEKGIILFHDTMVEERGFGVCQLWDEIRTKFPHFNFEHGFGLGVLLTGLDQPESVINFVKTANAFPSGTMELFSALGRRIQVEFENAKMEFENAKMSAQLERLSAIECSRDFRLGRALLRPVRTLKRFINQNHGGTTRS